MASLADLRRIKSGNLLQKAAGLAGTIGTVARQSTNPFMKALGSHDFGVSEMFGTPRARAADNTSIIPEWQKLGYRSEQEYINDHINNQSFAEVEQPARTSLQDLINQYAGGGGGQQAAQTNTVEPQILETYPGSGVWIDVSTPAGMDRYFSERRSYAENEAETYKSTEQKNLNLLLQQALNERNKYQSDYDTSWKTYLQDMGTNIENLDTAYGQGEARRMGKYTALSPNAYQSSMGTSGQYAAGELTKGKNRIAEKKATDEAQMTSDIEALNKYYNTYESQQKNAFESAVDEFRKQLLGQAGELASNINTAKAARGVSYGAADYGKLNQPNFVQADTTDIIPAIQFNSTGYTNPLLQKAATLAGGSKTPGKTTDSLKEYLY